MDENKEQTELLADNSGKANLSETELIRIRKEKIVNFLKKRYDWIVYIVLAFIVYLSVRIRTRPMAINPNTGKPLLWDIATDSWTLGPDLDPFLFLRWAEYIVEHGKLFAIDTMRYVPLFYDTRNELTLNSYMIAWFHKIAVFFGSPSVTYSAIIYPVFMFALTVIAFFLFVRVVFIDNMGKTKANIIALIASLFLTVLPIFLPRTIAGIPEKEATAFLLMFLAFYFFLSAWRSKNFKLSIVLSVLSGISTGAMALIWGGYNYVILVFMSSIFIVFVLGGVGKNKLLYYVVWIVSYSLIMWPFSARYPIMSLINRGTVIVAFIIFVHFIIFETKIKKYFELGRFSKIPSYLISVFCAILILIILASFVYGPSYIYDRISSNVDVLINPVSTRFVQTVAENKSPFFKEWVGSFGPYYKNIPIFFWLFFLGSISLFYHALNIMPRKDRIYMTGVYTLLLSSITFSKYAPDSRFNGINSSSLIFYALGFIVFIGGFLFYYYKYYKKGEHDKFKAIDLGIISVLSLFLLTLVSLRGGIRLVMVLTPSISMLAAYLVVKSADYALKTKESILKITALIIAGVIVIAAVFSGWQFYKQIYGEAGVYGPSSYTQQWQRAMAWVRENTPDDSVFAHWWDYGYWIQSIGKRATMLDGGNAQGYWNHMMGRYGLTGTDKREALELFYAHNVSHFLIDPTDIGKYTAFSSIGSDVSHDRLSWISTFVRDNNQIRETKNGTIVVYTGGTSLDEDIIYEENETRVFIPSRGGLGAILVEVKNNGEVIERPIGIYVDRDKQYQIPMRYAFYRGKFYDFGSGIEAGIFLLPRAVQTGEGLNIEKEGALLYLSKRTVKSQLARLYLYREDDPNFKLVHSEDDALVSFIKSQNPQSEDIVLFDGIRGPIRIWEINYPEDIELKQKYLDTRYPKEFEGLI